MLMIFGIKDNSIILTHTLLAIIATNIPVQLKTGFVVQGHIWEILSPCIIYPAVIFLGLMNVILQNWVLCRETEVKSSQIIACVYSLDSFMTVLLVFICLSLAVPQAVCK